MSGYATHPLCKLRAVAKTAAGMQKSSNGPEWARASAARYVAIWWRALRGTARAGHAGSAGPSRVRPSEAASGVKRRPAFCAGVEPGSCRSLNSGAFFRPDMPVVDRLGRTPGDALAVPVVFRRIRFSDWAELTPGVSSRASVSGRGAEDRSIVGCVLLCRGGLRPPWSATR